jgi:peptidoglycan/xylan/chitin deacetylase (PgdA/CDA1 family)
MDHGGMNAHPPPDPSWRWPEERWRAVARRVSAGRSLRPPSWPAGALCAVALSFDLDQETVELRDGGASIGRLSQGEYGSRAALPRILALLERHGAHASFFIPAVAGLLHPDDVRRIADAGHEIGLHGWIHEWNSELPEADERELLLRSADALERLAGARPVGMRTPSWDFSAATLPIARELGLLYDSSLMADDDCYELLLEGAPSGVVELPVEWIRDDAPYLTMHRAGALRPYTPPSALLEIFRAELDAACAERGVFQLTLHPHLIGHRSRIGILERLLEDLRGRSVWVATHAEVARHALAHGAS